MYDEFPMAYAHGIYTTRKGGEGRVTSIHERKRQIKNHSHREEGRTTRVRIRLTAMGMAIERGSGSGEE